MKKIILTLMMSAAVMASYAQADHEDVRTIVAVLYIL